MNGYYITRVETDALTGASLLAKNIYHFLRSRMDIRTGKTGEVYRISYQAIIENCETHITRGKGFQIVKPTLKELRIAIESLERAGLITKNADFVFTLNHAQLVSSCPKNTGHKNGITHRASSPRQSSISAKKRHQSPRKYGTHQSVGDKSEKKTTASTTAEEIKSASNAIDEKIIAAAAELDRLQKTLGYHIKHSQSTITPLLNSDMASLQTAVTAAIAARKRDKNPAPLNPSYIACFLNQPKAHPEDWKKSWSGIVSKGKSLGVIQKEGEPDYYFKHRVIQAFNTNVAA